MKKIFLSLQHRFGYQVYIWLAIAIYTIVLSIIEISAYNSFSIFTWDLGIFNQALWNTLNGRFLYYTAEPFYARTGCFLAAHFSPTILLTLPFYALYPQAETLLVASTVIVAIGALPAYRIASFLLKEEKVAVMIGIFYLLYPPLQGVTLSGFSPEPFATTLFLFIIYYMMKADFKKLAFVFPLGLMTHEASVPVIAFIALFFMLHYRSIKNKGFQVSMIMTLICILYLFFAQYMRTFFGWTGQPSLWHEWKLIGATSAMDLPFKVLINPVGAWESLSYDWMTKLTYVIAFFVPALFLPIWGSKGLIPSFPYFFISLFSTYPLYYNLEGHYTAFVAPFFLLALVLGITKLRQFRRGNIPISKLMKIIILTSVISLILISSSTFSRVEVLSANVEHNNIIHSFIRIIPQNASILTPSNIFPHVSNRPHAYTITPPLWGEEYDKVDREILQNLSRNDVDYVLLDFKAEPHYVSAAELIRSVFILPNARNYELANAEDGVMLFKRI